MQASKFNIVAPIADADAFYVVNLLSGHADVIDADEARQLQEPGADHSEAMIERGYVVDPAAEERAYREAYLDFVESRETDEVQLFYVPGYSCNFACSYCYQKSYDAPPPAEQLAVLDAFFAYVDAQFADRNKYVTLFGGEPLLPNETSRRIVERMVERTRERGLDLAVVTNGYHLASYVPTLTAGRIREVQVTLDGPRPVHDGRRHLAGGAPTFDAIVAGIDAALEAGLAVNLRTVVDRDNLDAYVELARFAIARGWTAHPRFKTQIGRNYELHDCQPGRDRLYSRLELNQELYRLARQHPELLQFHRPAFSIARHLTEHASLPSPLFDACPATKTEWAFDGSGHIFGCTATVGKPGESLGTFYPEVQRREDAIEVWEDRDVLSIPDCQDCSLQLACGGGCGSVAKNRVGSVAGSDCRPVAELISLGLGLYSHPEGTGP